MHLKHVGMNSMAGSTTTIFDVTEEDFDEAVVIRSQETPVLVDISADWCAPCRVLAPLLDRLGRGPA